MNRFSFEREHRKKNYDGVYIRRFARPLSFALDRYSDDDIGALSGSIAYISRRDAERHFQIIRRSLARVERCNRLLLEIGCGTGGYVRYMSRRAGIPAIGIDASSVAIATARKFVTPTTEFLCRDARDCGLPRSFAGAALAIDTLHLTDDRSAVLDEISRVLAPSAALVMTVLYTKTLPAPSFVGPQSWKRLDLRWLRRETYQKIGNGICSQSTPGDGRVEVAFAMFSGHG